MRWTKAQIEAGWEWSQSSSGWKYTCSMGKPLFVPWANGGAHEKGNRSPGFAADIMAEWWDQVGKAQKNKKCRICGSINCKWKPLKFELVKRKNKVRKPRIKAKEEYMGTKVVAEFGKKEEAGCTTFIVLRVSASGEHGWKHEGMYGTKADAESKAKRAATDNPGRRVIVVEQELPASGI